MKRALLGIIFFVNLHFGFGGYIPNTGTWADWPKVLGRSILFEHLKDTRSLFLYGTTLPLRGRGLGSRMARHFVVL
jgi:hypothetical protein